MQREYDAMQFNMVHNDLHLCYDLFICQTANHQLTKQVKVLFHILKVSDNR